MPVKSRSRLDWDAHRSRIEDLYWNHGGKLREVMKIMAEVHGFDATEKMYKKYFKAWGLEKNIKTLESLYMIGIAERRRAENKETIFIRHGKLVDLRKLYRFKRRHKLTRDGGSDPLLDAQVATPPHITYRTPEPDPLVGSLPPAPQPYPDPDTSEGEQAAMAESPGSYGFDSEGTPPLPDIPWEQPMPVSWPSNDAYFDHQRTTHTSVVAHFIPDAFSRHQTNGSLHEFSRQDPSPTFFQPPWVDPTDPPSLGYHPSTAGNHSWLFNSPPPPQAVDVSSCELSCELDGFSIHHSPAMGQIMLDINAFSNPSATHAPSRNPETALYVLNHDPLIDAVQHNDLDRTAGLLAGGANPNCTARGGITALHSASSQGNAEMIKLLTDHGANLNAMTDKRESVLLFAVRGRDHPDSTGVQAHANPNHANNPHPHHSDEDAVRTLKALFDSPTRWVHLLRSLDKVDQDGVSPLMLAVENGFERTATMLLERGARPDVRDHANHTALWYAARNNHRNLVRLLLLADPAVSTDRDLSHILKLASKNLTGHATTTDHDRGEDGQAGWWDGSHRSASTLIAEEMVRVCREMGVMDGLLRLADQRRKAAVVELLSDAMGRLDTSQSCEGVKS